MTVWRSSRQRRTQAIRLPVGRRTFAAKAKRVIYLHMTGSPPNLDMFDYKPELVTRSDQDCPDQFLAGREFAFTSGTPKLMGSPRKWKRVGKSGMWMSDAIPNFHDIADENVRRPLDVYRSIQSRTG